MKKRPPLAEMHSNLVFDDIEEIEEVVPKKSYKKDTLVEIPISELVVEKNIRDTYADDSLEELGDSIIENGQIQPIIVTPKNGKYVVKVGHRRYKACLLRDVATVKCIVQDDFRTEKERIITQAIENEQRLNLSSREREAYIAQLVDIGMTQNEIAKALHKTKGWVSEALTSYNFVSENKELFDELAEEPSTRDAWKASTLTKSQLKSAVSEAKKNGGTKDAFKKEIAKQYNKNTASKIRKSKNYVLSYSIELDSENSTCSIEMMNYYDEELSNLVIQNIKKYYEDKGFVCK